MWKKSSLLKQLGQIEPSLAGSIYVRFKPGIDGPWVCPFQICVWQDASCQVWLHFAKQFQSKRFFQTVANQKQELSLAAIFVGGMERNGETL
jgi:hypothetical protein